MPRPHRIDYPGAVHHVMNRGAARQPTFTGDFDRQDFTGLWQEAVERFGIVVLAYAWMGNHYHALVVSPDGQLSETLRYIGSVYTQRFNRRHERDGALFRGRFHSVLVDSDEYLERVARYVERNPLEAGIVSVDRLVQYRWSSLSTYVHPQKSDWVSTGLLLGRFGSRQAYLRYVLSNRNDDELAHFYSEERHSRIVLGRQSFVDSLPAEAKRLNPIAGVPQISLQEIDDAVSQFSRNFDSTARLVATQLGQQLGRASRRELAERYDFPSTGAVSQATMRARQNEQAMLVRQQVLDFLGR